MAKDLSYRPNWQVDIWHFETCLGLLLISEHRQPMRFSMERRVCYHIYEDRAHYSLVPVVMGREGDVEQGDERRLLAEWMLDGEL